MSQDPIRYGDFEMWSGPTHCTPTAIKEIIDVRLQAGCICLTLQDDDGDETEWAISLADLVSKHAEFIRYSSQGDAKESKQETISALRKAIVDIEAQQPD